MVKKPAKKATKKKTPVADALRDELEEIEAVPARPATVADVQRAMRDASNTSSSTITATTAYINFSPSTVTATLPPRGDEKRTATVSLIADANGTDSYLVIDGCGVGGHTCTTRVWPDDQYHQHTFDGDTFEQRLKFVATHAIVTIDDGDEIRVGTPTDR